ncbi:MAG: acyl-CoA dehydrogenase family protein [Actinobacteria bacterium]|nr:acyl-CoA dehydrogenase family protein [Actinomycetota bacterium]
MRRTIFEPEHDSLREVVRDFVADHVLPATEDMEAKGMIDRRLFEQAGELGLLGFAVPAEHGGAGVDDFRFNAVITEEFARAGANSVGLSFTLINDMVLPYLLDMTDEEQQARWLPDVATGRAVLAVAMSEPGAGSDLAGIRTRAVRDGDHYVVNGTKTFISNGQHADLVVAACRTDDDPHAGLTLLVVEADTPGFSRGRNLHKLGLHAQDTSELSFTDARVPVTNRLGEEGSGFRGLVSHLPQERLAIAVSAVAAAEGILERTLSYVKERTAFGTPIGSFQHSRFLLAELDTEISIARVFIDACIARHVDGELSATDAAKAKWWATELQVKVADRCLQLHGGYGYMREYQISRDFADARVQTIYGGTTEIMKEIIGRGLGL